MKCQRKPATQEPYNEYLSPSSSPAIYEAGLGYSSQRSFFNYSIIDTDPVTYELNSAPVCGTYSVSMYSELPDKMDFTMKKSEAYFRCKERCSTSSEIHN